ncbi:beta-1,3-glucan-binding protein 2-like [Melitaea cinxia]|uniref:beta-1,3-glucan-binding protein 2-like n=1 Tax=Melitaea cinxia TaxID=113334 RepID=UPI001E272D3F|nr:beta-1,3-glucan-binding protein 2-like [Melitaea cinxia]
MEKEIIIFFIITYLCSINAQNEPKSVKLEALTPQGLRVTIQDEGYSSCTFAGSLNRETETKQWQLYVPRAKNGLWVFTDRNYELRIGDHITYSIAVAKHSSEFRINGNWTVSEFVIDNEVSTCNISETNTLCSTQICKGTLIFSEEFDEPLNLKWQIEHMFPQGPDYPFNAYSNDKVKVGSGVLVISPSRTLPGYSKTWDMGYACTGEPGTNECKQRSVGPQILPPVVSGKVTTRKLFSFKYGRIDVRAKLPEGDWLIPEINLEPLYNEYGRQQYGSGLIRIAYVKGNQEFDHELYGGPIVCDKEPCRSSFLKKSPKISSSWNKHFHVFSLIWKPDGFELLVDDKLYGEVKPPFEMSNIPHTEVWERGTAITPFDELFYISLGVRVGGINDFADTPEKPWLNRSPKAMFKFWKDSYFWKKTWTSPELIVDYVRVYSL